MTNTTNTLIFNVTEHRNDNSGCDYNLFAEMLLDQGGTVQGEDGTNGMLMYISGLDLDEINDIAEQAGVMNVLNYIDDNSLDENASEIDECDEVDECNEDAPYFDEFNEDFELFNDDEFEDEIDDLDAPAYPSYEEVTGIEDIDFNEYSDEPAIDDYDEDTTLGWESELSAYDDEIEEAFESRKFKGRNRRLNENSNIKERYTQLLKSIFDAYDAISIPVSDMDVYTQDGGLITHIAMLGDPDVSFWDGDPETEEDAVCYEVYDNEYINLCRKFIYNFNNDVYESKTVKRGRNRHLNEKKKGCCPPKSRCLNEKKLRNMPAPEPEEVFVARLMWNDLQNMGYSEGDLISVDDYCTAVQNLRDRYGDSGILHNLCEDEGSDYDVWDALHNLYGVEVFAPEVLLGDGPGNYTHIDGDFSMYESRKFRSKNNLISLTEALKSFDEKDQKKLDKVKMSVDDILKMVKGQSIGEREAREAFAKLKKEQNAIKKIKKSETNNFSVLDIPGVTKAIKAMIAADPEKAEDIKKFRESLVESVVTALATKKKSLHENAIIKGKKFNTISYKEMLNLYESVMAKKKELTKKLKATDVRSAEGKALKESIAKKNKTIMYLSEELAYRQVAANVFKRLNEDEEAKEEEKKQDDQPSMDDLAAMFGSNDMTPDAEDSKDEGDADTKDTEEETEEVELSRVVIEMATKEDAEQLMSLCKDAGIPEEAMEIETGDEDEESDDTDVTDEGDADAESDEETTEDTEDDGSKNESIRYSNLRRLFEADGDEDAEGDDTEATDDAEDATDEGDADTEETEDEGSVKFVLTDSDYVNELAGVLSDEYGITEEEFENMIGGEIVEADDDKDSEDDTFEEDDNKSDSKDEETEEDDIDAADIFGNM